MKGFQLRQTLSVLDEYVIGQSRAKRVLSVAVHNHYAFGGMWAMGTSNI